MNKDIRTRTFPFILTPIIVFFDQVTKHLVSTNLGLQEVAFSFFGGFINIIHERNTGIALSLGAELPYYIRIIIFALIPLGILGYVVYYALRTPILLSIQRYALAGIVGGGLGNIIDRIFRSSGVVDFISFRLYGILGLSYFPTFNIADFSLTLAAGVFVMSLLIKKGEQRETVI